MLHTEGYYQQEYILAISQIPIKLYHMQFKIQKTAAFIAVASKWSKHVLQPTLTQVI